jgi:hypothetical protein
MSTPSFHVVPDSLFNASLKFLDLQAASGRLLSGMGSGLGPTGGMAGNDDAGRAFATRYNPAAQSVSNGLGSVNKQLGDIADGLLAMAFNYLQAEMGSNFLVPQVFGDGPQKSCRADEQAVAVPAAEGVGQESSLPLIGQFWPQGDPDRLRHAAATWRQVAALAEELGRRGATVIAGVTDANSGKAIDAFSQSWQPMSVLMTEIAATSRKLVTASDSFAQRVDDERHTIEAIGASIAVATTAGVLLTVFTLGFSDVIVTGGDAALIAAAGDAAITFGVEAAGAGEVAALVGADAAIEGSILTLPAIAAVAAETELVGVSAGSLELVASIVPPGVALFLTNVQDVAAASNDQSTLMSGGLGNPLLNGAVPPQPGSPFQPLSPQQQAQAITWVNGLPSQPVTSSAPWAQYQKRVAGPTEYEMPTGDGRTVAADGFRPLDGAIIDAKYTPDASCSIYNLDNRGSSSFYQPVFESAFAKSDGEFNKYAAVITDPANHAQFLEVEVNDPKLVPYFQFLMAAQHVPGIVRVVP